MLLDSLMHEICKSSTTRGLGWFGKMNSTVIRFTIDVTELQLRKDWALFVG